MAADKGRQGNSPWHTCSDGVTTVVVSYKECRLGGWHNGQQQVVDFGFDGLCHKALILFAAQHQMRQHVGQTAHVERMVGVVVVAIVVTVMGVLMMTAMAVYLCLKDEPYLVGTIVMMVRHYSM